MRSLIRRLALVVLTAAGTACAGQIEVQTLAAPDANFGSLRRFHMLPAPSRRDGRPLTTADDAMIANSIAYREIGDAIVKAFRARGYVLDDSNPDFAVAFYATEREKLDVSAWDYGYPFTPPWPHYPVAQPVVTTYTEGSVVVDVVSADRRALLWRGEGKAALTRNPRDDVKQLAKAAAAIVGRFPHVGSTTLAAQ